MARASKLSSSAALSSTAALGAAEVPGAGAGTPERLFAGTSGWAYPTWKPGFYPERMAAKRFLEYYSSRLNSVEVNYTFRALPTAKMLEGWLAATPEGFRFSFKAPQRITHFARLRECEALVAQFAGALEPVRAAGKLGVLLFQLPPNFKVDTERLAGFLAIPELSGPRGITGEEGPGKDARRIAFEFRDASWFSEEVYGLLRAHDAALCIAESDDLASPEVHPAATHTCFRLRRNGGYTSDEVAQFAERFTRLAEERDVFCYFKHEDEPTGALNASEFLELARAPGMGADR